MGFHSNDNEFMDKENEGFLLKIKSFPKRFSDYSRTKKLLVSLSTIAIIGVLGFGTYWLSPIHKVRSAEASQAKLMENLKPTNKPRGKYKYNNVKNVPDLNELFKLRKNGQNLTLRGQISIPKYKVNVPVFEGTNNYTLAWGVGTAKPNQQFGKKNFAVQGHNYNELSVTKNWFFSNFEKGLAPTNKIDLSYIRIPLKTKVYARNNDNIYTYQIIHRQITDVRYPNSGNVLTDSAMKNYKNKPIITMATCYEQNGITYPTQRIILVGRLINKTKPKNFKQMNNVFSGDLN